MHDIATSEAQLAGGNIIDSPMDRLGIGTFVLDAEGYLIRCNNTAAEIFGSYLGSDECHFSSIDSVMSLGLAEKIPAIANGSETFCRHGVSCTNPTGMFHVLDVCCSPMTGPDGQRLVLGVVRDAGAKDSASDRSVDRYQELKIFSTVAASLSSSDELEQILEVILTGATASQGLGFNRAFLFLYDAENSRLTGHLAIGPASPEEAGHIWHDLESKNLSLDELLDIEKRQPTARTSTVNSLIRGMTFDLGADSLIGEACSSGAWINLETVDKIDPVTVQFADRLGTRNMALVPMVAKGHLMGLLAADCAITKRPISNASVQLLQILANQAAVAMERARLYQEQVARTSQLEEMNRLLGESQDHIIKIEKMSIIGELTAAIAHELRNPLAVIGGFANLMLKSDITDEQREYLNIIASETSRSETVLNQVMDFHEASQSDRVDIDFSELVERNLKLARSRLRQPGDDISLSLSPQKMTVFGNYDQLSHAFYQFFRIVAEELIPPGRAEVRTEREGNRALMFIRVTADDAERNRVVKAMKQIFSENKTSQRLTVLVAGETIRYHGGNFGLSGDSECAPSLYVEIPLQTEK